MWCYLSRYYICYNSDMVLPFQILLCDMVLFYLVVTFPDIICYNSDMVLPFIIYVIIVMSRYPDII